MPVVSAAPIVLSPTNITLRRRLPAQNQQAFKKNDQNDQSSNKNDQNLDGKSKSVFHKFFDKYSAMPNNRTMMLNDRADEIEEFDRWDILSSLPDLTDMDVVDIGAGIGRFTSELAKTARHVLSTDFIDSFIEKNRERNSCLGNVDFMVGDAVNLELPDQSKDLVFTNWLMMYVPDEEMVAFFFKILRWLRPNGYFHLRESCSQSSTGGSKRASMHGTDNPTFYRFSSQYINLLREIRLKDCENRVWRFDPAWGTSVSIYVNRFFNWRQVHWLVRKVQVEPKLSSAHIPSQTDLCRLLSNDWPVEQLKIDNHLLKNKINWPDAVFLRATAMNECRLGKEAVLFAYSPRENPDVAVNGHVLAQKHGCDVLCIETNPYYYRTALARANELKDPRIRITWTDCLGKAAQYWLENSAHFDAFIGTEVLATEADPLTTIKAILENDGRIVLLEPVMTKDRDETFIRKTLEARGFHQINIEDVSSESVENNDVQSVTNALKNDAVIVEQQEDREDLAKNGNCHQQNTVIDSQRWLLVQATVS